LIARSVRIVPQMLGGGVAYAAVIVQEGLARVLLFAAVAAVFGLAVALLGWWRFRYTVGPSEIVIESGIVRRRRRVIPYDRIQDIAIERPLLARLLGTARVKIETGGSAADEGDLDMIALADASELRDHVRHGAAAASAEAAEEPVLFELGVLRLLQSGLFDFSLLFLAVIFGIFQYLDQFGLVDMTEWLNPKRADAAAGLANLRVTAVLIGLLLLLGILTGVARTAARDFGFRLTRAPGGLRRRRGLFTLSEVVIPIRRTQVALVESDLLSRLLGWYRLSFQTLGADRAEGGVQVAAPFARLEEVAAVLAEAGFPAPPPRRDFERLPRRAWVRRAGPPVVLAIALVSAALVFEPRLAIAAAAAGAVGLAALLRWRKHAYALDGQALFVTSGLLKRRIWTIPFEKTQTIVVSSGPVQRRLRLASLLVDTAGAAVIRAPEIVDLDAGDAGALQERLLRLFHERRRWPAAAAGAKG
jgi:putative membrane protein